MIGHEDWRRPWHAFCAAVVLVALVVSSCNSVLAPMIPSVSAPSEDEETKISREFRREAKKIFKFPNNPEVERYVDRIGRRIRGIPLDTPLHPLPPPPGPLPGEQESPQP